MIVAPTCPRSAPGLAVEEHHMLLDGVAPDVQFVCRKVRVRVADRQAANDCKFWRYSVGFGRRRDTPPPKPPRRCPAPVLSGPASKSADTYPIRSKNSFTAMALEKACGAGRASSRSDLALDQREHTSCSWMVLGVEVMRRS
jgi:hypothetical protein